MVSVTLDTAVACALVCTLARELTVCQGRYSLFNLVSLVGMARISDSGWGPVITRPKSEAMGAGCHTGPRGRRSIRGPGG